MQRGTGERIVQRLLDDDIGWLAVKLGQERPSRAAPFEAVARLAAMPDPHHLAAVPPHHGREGVDAPDHAGEVMLGGAVDRLKKRPGR